MRAEYVNAFVGPSVRVLRQMARTRVRVGNVTRLDRWALGDSLSVVIGLHGPMPGSVVLTAGRGVAWALASRIADEELGAARQADVHAILGELANTMVGNATGALYDLGMREGITPPTLVAGPDVSFNFGGDVESVKVPLETEVGSVDLIVSLARESPP